MSDDTSIPVRTAQQLDLSVCSVGSTSHWMITIVEDGLGQPVAVPVIVARGASDGPVIGIVAALHGNELNGVGVLQRLFDELDAQAMQGTVVGVVVANVPGLLRHQRVFTDGADLNHVMPGIPDGNESETYAYRLIERIASQFQYFVDLHTASFGCVNSLYVRADLSDPIVTEMAKLQWPQIVLNDRPSDYTLRGAIAEHGVPSMTVEICDPHIMQPAAIDRTLAGLLRVLAYLGITCPVSGDHQPLPEEDEPFFCDRSIWIYTDRGGLLSVNPVVAQHVKRGETLAQQVNVFGELVRQYKAPRDGVIIGHSCNSVAQSGSRILHLGYRL